MKIIYIALLICIAVVAKSQDIKPYGPQPKVGEELPDFVLNDVNHFTKSRVTKGDFKGKWLILDFWASFCVPCIASFPKLSKIQDKYKDKIQIMMVGLVGERAHSDIITSKSMFDRLTIKQKLNLSTAYDSTLNFKWGIWSVPTMIIVDEKGIVQAITEGENFNDKSIDALLSGNNPYVGYKDYFTQVYDQSKLFTGDNYENLVQSSLLSKHKDERQWFGKVKLEKIDSLNYSFRIQGAPLFLLYRYAYFGKPYWDSPADSLYGKVYPYPIIEASDTSAFRYSFKDTIFGLYNYSINRGSLIKEDSTYIINMLQNDLRNSFNYNVTIEMRKMPCWNLVKIHNGSDKNLKTKGGNTTVSSALASGFSAKNVSIKDLISIIANFHETPNSIILDRTEITTNIDITVDAVMSDFEDVRQSLRRSGLDLVSTTHLMKVVVIRDPKPDSSSK